MKKKFLIGFSAFLLIFLNACTTYKPTGYNILSQNVPLMKGKHESQVMFTGGANHLEEQLAFAPTEHLSALANFYQNAGKTKGYTNELGIGYFKHYNSDLVWEVYGIYSNAFNYAHVEDNNGSGLQSNLISYTHDLQANYNGYSVQFDIGNKLPKAEFGISFRYGLIDYSNFYYHLKTDGYSYYSSSDTTYHLNNKLQQFLTVAPTFKFGNENLKWLLQLSFHFDLTNGSDTGLPPYYSEFLITNALVIAFPFQNKKQEHKE